MYARLNKKPVQDEIRSESIVSMMKYISNFREMKPDRNA